MSAQRCFTAWNWPIGPAELHAVARRRPAAVSTHHGATPTASAARAPRPAIAHRADRRAEHAVGVRPSPVDRADVDRRRGGGSGRSWASSRRRHVAARTGGPRPTVVVGHGQHEPRPPAAPPIDRTTPGRRPARRCRSTAAAEPARIGSSELCAAASGSAQRSMAMAATAVVRNGPGAHARPELLEHDRQLGERRPLTRRASSDTARPIQPSSTSSAQNAGSDSRLGLERLAHDR